MGGRGASSSSSGIGKGIIKKGEAKELYLSRAMERKNAVLVAGVDKSGGVYLRPADDSFEYEGVKGKPTGTIRVQHGLVNGRPVNLDLTKAKEIRGNTYENQGAIRAAGFKWSKTKRVWYNDRLPEQEKKKYL